LFRRTSLHSQSEARKEGNKHACLTTEMNAECALESFILAMVHDVTALGFQIRLLLKANNTYTSLFFTFIALVNCIHL